MALLERFFSLAGKRSAMKPRVATPRQLLRSAVIVLFDVCVAAIAFVSAYFTVSTRYPGFDVPALADKTVGFALAAGLSFLFLGQYRGSWRYVSIPDLITIIKGSVAAVVVYTVTAFLLTRGDNVPRSVPVLAAIYLIGGLAGARLVYRISMERMIRIPGRTPAKTSAVRKVLLCGFSDKAESLIRSNRRDSRRSFDIAGILDDSHLNHGRLVQGVKVLGTLDELGKIQKTLERRGIKVSELVVTEPSPGRKRLAHILELANAHSIKVARIPDFSETATVTSDTLVETRPVELGDLLERPEVNTDLASVAALIEGRVVLATGAGGSIGSELSRQIAAFRPKKLVITDSSEFDLYELDNELRDTHPDLHIETHILNVRDAGRVKQVFNSLEPEVVFHAAALKHVALVETNPLEAVKTNLLGTRNVADAALAAKVAMFVMISTDKAVNPTNVMGATKRAAEAYCQSLDVNAGHTRFKTVRFGNVLGSKGSVVPRFQDQIAAGGPVTVTHPHVVRYFMTIPEAVRLVLHASAHDRGADGERGSIMVLDMGKPVRIVDLAERMIQLAGYKPHVDIEIVFSGLRPGEKLYEELFDPAELQDGRTEEGYVVASPRVVDRMLLERTLAQIETALEREDAARTIQLLGHLVPEYGRSTADISPLSDDFGLQLKSEKPLVDPPGGKSQS